METKYFAILSTFFQLTHSANLLLPDTLTLENNLSQFRKCTIIILSSTLDSGYSFRNKIRDNSFKIEPLTVSAFFKNVPFHIIIQSAENILNVFPNFFLHLSNIRISLQSVSFWNMNYVAKSLGQAVWHVMTNITTLFCLTFYQKALMLILSNFLLINKHAMLMCI